MQYETILMVWVRITLGFQPRVIRTQTIRGKLGNGEHLSSWAYKTYMYDLKSLVKHLLKKYIPPGTYGLEKKMAAFAITVAISGNCELY